MFDFISTTKLGVILYVMLSAYPPFFGENEIDIRTKIAKGKVKFKGTIIPHIIS